MQMHVFCAYVLMVLFCAVVRSKILTVKSVISFCLHLKCCMYVMQVPHWLQRSIHHTHLPLKRTTHICILSRQRWTWLKTRTSLTSKNTIHFQATHPRTDQTIFLPWTMPLALRPGWKALLKLESYVRSSRTTVRRWWLYSAWSYHLCTYTCFCW